MDYELHHADAPKTPLVVLHGGPGLPHDYLLPLCEIINDRPILFHDQLGCGASDRPNDLSLYSIENSAQDLQTLLEEVKFGSFHLYGQSYGGILAFEYLKQQQQQPTAPCYSVVLSSAPSSIPLLNQEWERLLHEIPGFLKDDAFHQRHVCRTAPSLPLQRAYERASTSVWGGIDVISNYEAVASSSLLSSCKAALALRGEFDFVTTANLSRWKQCLHGGGDNDEHDDCFEMMQLEGCSHHGLLENPSLYGKVLDDFMERHDP